MINIGKYKIGPGHKPFIVAEMSGNHQKSLEHALKLVEIAAKAGVQAVKLQTYTPDTMTLNSREEGFVINDNNSLWHGSNLYDLYEQAYTPWEWHKKIFLRANELGLVAFSTPFDTSAVDFLESLDVPCYKVSSFEITEHDLIRRIGQTEKPVLMSTGMATVSEISESVDVLRSSGCSSIILLKCTSTYPASPLNSNLKTIPHMASLFNCEVGISDHTLGIGTAVAAVAQGANVVEKHFTMSRNDGGVDSLFSMEPDELEQLVIESNNAWLSIGNINYGPSRDEVISLKYRRSLYIVENVCAGDVLTKSNIRALRPFLGLAPKYYDIVLGKKVKQDLAAGTPLQWDLLFD